MYQNAEYNNTYHHTKFELNQFINVRKQGLVVEASASRAEDPGFESRLRRDFSGSIHTLLTYLCPSLPVKHRPSTTPPHPPPPRPPPSHSVLGCPSHLGPVGPLLFQLCFSVSPPAVARPASLSIPLRVPGHGLACGAGCWLPEGASDPAPLPPQYLFGH